VHYLITGHTGFKGSWLTLMLKELGHDVSGVSLEPEKKSLFEQAKIYDLLKFDQRIDITNRKKVEKSFKEIKPDILVHFAAQSLVGKSYVDPLDTFNTNVMGTLNVLEAANRSDKIKAILLVTSDKVYKKIDREEHYFTETDSLGVSDPYGTSKAAADIAAQGLIKYFGEGVPTAIARAGNVIGGGDWASDRLVPDIVAALENNKTLLLRYPEAVRPWQHVLDCLNGYLHLINMQLTNKVGGEWNFGPNFGPLVNVQNFVDQFVTQWGKKEQIWIRDTASQNDETKILQLNSSKARSYLGWQEKMSFEVGIQNCVEWYKRYKFENIRDLTMGQISNYFAMNVN
jgi:CDP-glucose 4,6-dehydratase